MSFFGCDSKYSCSITAIIASIIIGVVAAFLRITAVITVTPAFLWTVFGIAIVYLAILLATSTSSGITGVCSTISTLLTGILGTILFSTILLAITFEATSIIGAIIVGLLLFFFSLLVTGTACTVKCYLRNSN